MAVGNEWTTGQFKRNITFNYYLVHYKPYQGVKKESQVTSFTKCGFWDNVVLRVMEYLTLTVSFGLFMDNYFTSLSFCVLTHIEVNSIRVRGSKIDYANKQSSGTNSCKN